MKPMARGTKQRWAFSVSGAVALAGLMLWLFRAAPAINSPVQVGVNRQTVTLVNERDQAVNDESVLLDPTPLFLPTKWNSTQRELTSREPGGRFQGYDTPKLSFSESELKLGLPPPIATPAGPAEAVAAAAPTGVLAGFGRTNLAVTAADSRGAFVEVELAATGRKVLTQAVSVVPPAKAAWQPVEYVACVDAAGLVGPLVVTERSGTEEVDSYFADYLIRSLRVGERFPPGFYRITVGP
jgi:hypothetical protein